MRREKKGKPTKGKRPWPKRTQSRQQRRGRTKVARERREEGRQGRREHGVPAAAGEPSHQSRGHPGT